MAERRQRLVGDLNGKVLEVGVGNGLNLAHYQNVAELTAIEPDAYMVEKLKPRLANARFPVRLLEIDAEELTLADASFDAVVASLVLCSVDDPRQALAQIHRVLRPGGQFRFMEHVQARGLGGAALTAITPIWSRLGGGCHPNRHTEEAIRSAGFEIVAIERYRLGYLPHIQGKAIKR